MASKKKNVDTPKKSTAKKATRSVQTNNRKKAVKKKAAAPKKEAKEVKKVVAKKKPVTAKEAPKKKATPDRGKDKKSVTKKAIVKKTTNVKKAATPTGQKATASKKAKTTPKKAATHKAETTKSTAKPVAAAVKKAPKSSEPAKTGNNHAAAREVKPTAGKTITKKAPTVKPKYVYHPEPSILDIPPENNGPRRRYSDNDLQEFKDLIQRKLEAARKELVYLQGLITRKDEAGTDDTENKYMGVEDGGGTMEREQLSQLASRQIQYIDHLEKALVRIENKTYGICRETGRLIDKARLRAVPHATLSIEAKLAKKK